MGKQVKIINLFYLVLGFCFLSCKSNVNNAKDIEAVDFAWLCGNWINNSDSNALFFENWKAVSSNDYSGVSFIIAKQDTVFYESIQLLNSDSGVFYAVTVRNQNGAETVRFKMLSSNNKTYVFENRKHDFPQTITYHYMAPDTINAWIEGSVKGEFKKESFLMYRAKPLSNY
jgi:hypothetical protein